MLYKRGRFYWLDIRIKGQRIRRSLQTSNKLKALNKYTEKKKELIEEFGKGKVKNYCLIARKDLDKKNNHGTFSDTV
jgi:hypothetical protein